MGSLTFDDMRSANVHRCTSPDGFMHPLEAWSPLEWAGATAGEAGEAATIGVALLLLKLQAMTGEAANTAKKLKRILGNTAGNVNNETIEGLRAKLARELADVVIYADLNAAAQGIDLGVTVRQVFNAKSVEVGSVVRL